MSGRIYTGAEALALLEATTLGPWDDVRVGRMGTGLALSHEEQVCGPKGRAAVILTHDGSAEAHANARAMRAAPDLAASVVHWEARALRAEAERDALQAAVLSVRAHVVGGGEGELLRVHIDESTWKALLSEIVGGGR